MRAKYEETRRRKKDDVAAYKARKDEEARQRFMLRILHFWRGARGARMSAEQNAQRVGYRIEAYWAKVQAQNERRRQEAEEEREIEERLERLRATVAPVIPDDPTRHLAETAAVAAHGLACRIGEKETGTRKYATNDKNFYSGYTMTQLMGDTRMRLAMALHTQVNDLCLMLDVAAS
jgi:hypothetical protein